MVYCLLLAGGSGTRMGNQGVPKQFLPLNEVPIIIHTINNIKTNKEIDKIIIVCNEKYCEYLHDLLQEYGINEKIDIVVGGSSRLESALLGINHISNNYGINKDDIFISHDAVRPFVSSRIIKENIEGAKKYGATTTVLDILMTFFEEKDGKIIRAYPRDNLYEAQSPQAFNIELFMKNVDKTPDYLKQQFTSLEECMMHNGVKIVPVKGDRENIKITTPLDLNIGTEILQKHNFNPLTKE